ncbi:MAG: LysR family transcriptional regulator [Eubacterium sp.]|nr:LysR family transcriptional regulator [Eubacterium sp.]
MDTNIQKYLAFVKTVEFSSFSKAAEALVCSQSSISRMISDLEKDLDITLLERDRNGVVLTSDGTRLLPYAQNLCQSYYNLQEEVDDLNGIQTGLIRIGTFSSVASQWLPRIIKQFQIDYPNIAYEMLMGDYTEIENWIDERRVDCAFLILPTRPEFDSMELAEDPLLAVLPENHPLARLDAVPVKELEKEPFMLLEKGGKSEIADILKQYALHPDIRFTTLDDYAIMAMVEQGLGVSILPGLILKRNPYHVVLKPLDPPAFRKIGIALKESRTASAATKKFMQYLKYRNPQVL